MKVIIAICFVLLHLMSFAQNNKDKVDQIKKGYFTSELKLTPAETEGFWGVFKEFEEKTRRLRNGRRVLIQSVINDSDSLTKEEVQKMTIAIYNSEIEEINLKKECFLKTSNIIGVHKASKVSAIERQFKRELLKKLNEGNDTELRRPKRPKQF